MIRYILLVNLYAALLYGLYCISLAKKSNHNWSRFYLLLCAILPFVLPIFQLRLSGSSAATIEPIALAFQKLDQVIIKPENTFSFVNWAQIIYLPIAALLLFRLITQLLRIRNIIIKHKTQRHPTYILVEATGMPVSSFLNYIFLKDSTINPLLLAHEQRHIALRHTYDILLLRLLSCFGFFNLLLPFISKSLKIVHEYQADAVGENALPQYQKLMLQHQFQKSELALTHSFSLHPLKLRMMMLNKKNPLKKSNKIALLAGFIFISGGGLWAQSQNIKATPAPQNKAADEVISIVEQPASANFEFSDYLSKNLSFPKEYGKDKVNAKIIIKMIIDTDGKVTDATVVRAKGTINGKELTDDQLSVFKNEGLRVVNNMPDWIPGQQGGKTVKSYMQLPITFRTN